MDELEIRRRRALYRSCRRGTRELDLKLGQFAKARVPHMDGAWLTAFEELLAQQDPEIDSWLQGEAPPEGVAQMVDAVRAFLAVGRP
jgi:antitoxin CptB